MRAALLGAALLAGGAAALTLADRARDAPGFAGVAYGQSAAEALAALGEDAYFGPSCDRSTARDRRVAVYAEVELDGAPAHVMAFLKDDRVAAIEVEDLAVPAGRLDAAACRALGAERHAERGGAAEDPVKHRYYGREELWLWPIASRGGGGARVYVSHEVHRARCRLFERRRRASSSWPTEEQS